MSLRRMSSRGLAGVQHYRQELEREMEERRTAKVEGLKEEPEKGLEDKIRSTAITRVVVFRRRYSTWY